MWIWVHGGSHRFGGSNDYDNNEWGEASTLVAMSDIIVVLVNYRLGGHLAFLLLKALRPKAIKVS